MLTRMSDTLQLVVRFGGFNSLGGRSQEGGERYWLRCSQEGGKRTKHSSSLGVNERAPATLQPSGMLDLVED